MAANNTGRVSSVTVSSLLRCALKQTLLCIRDISCRTVALWGKNVDRPESYSTIQSKNCLFTAQKQVAHGLDLISPYKTFIGLENIRSIMASKSEQFVRRLYLFPKR